MPEIMFNGPEGRLEGRYHHSKETNAPIALILHPNSQQGGTMNNTVVYAMYQVFQRRGYSVLRFNFRGVGRSQGVYDRGEGELSDAASALDWLQTYNPNARGCWVGGFSFGAWIAMQLLMRRPEIDGFICSAPPAGSQDFSFLAPCPSSGLMIQGSADELTPVEATRKLVTKLSNQRDIHVELELVDGANHFFRNRLEQLQVVMDAYLDRMTTQPLATAAQ